MPTAGEACQRCTVRGIPCSNVYTAMQPGKSGRSQDPHSKFATIHPSHPSQHDSTASSNQQRKALHPSYVALSDEMEGSRSGYDIGTGTPSEILREGELSKELLMLYFANFSDIHFMFDEERFVREFDLGEIQKVVLYAMMALGIKCVVLRAIPSQEISSCVLSC
jgi:hypothetical protein